MQNTQQQTTSAEYVINMAWNFMNHARGQMSTSDLFPLMLAFLYSYHKGYYFHVIDDRRFEFPQNDDALLCDLVKCIPSDIRIHANIREFFDELMCMVSDRLLYFGRDEFNVIYPEVLKGLFDLMSTNADRSNSEFYTPAEISKLIAYIVKSNECFSVFDPFCGTASIVHELYKSGNFIRFEGQELMERTALYARLNLEAVNGNDSNIKICDSFGYWNNDHFDAVVSCPPLGLRLTQSQIWESENFNPEFPCRSVEEIMQIRSFHNNHASLTVTLLATGFCFRGNRDYEMRRYLVDNNLVDTIIALPTNILYGTSIPSVILVCKRERAHGEPIKFIHAEDYYLGNLRKRTFDYNRFIEMIEGDADDVVKVSIDEVLQYDYNLNPSLYYKKDFNLKEGQQVKRISELLEPVEGERISARDVTEMVSIGNLNKDFIEVLLNNGKQSAPSEVRRNSSCRFFNASDSKYLFAFSIAGESRYGINTDGNSFNCTAEIKVYKVNESLVSPEYIAYKLITNDAISKGRMPLSGYMMHSIVIDSPSVQKEIVNKIVQQYDQKVTAEREADAMRLGVKQNISDLEHMLGSTQLRISKIIARLESATPASENYSHLVKSMKDNIEYMNRVIHYNNARIDSESFNLKEADIVEFAKSYIDAWNNYGGGYFEIVFVNDLFDTPKMSFDKTLLTVMLDSILNNAIRHSFHKRKNYTVHNMVQLRLSVVEYKDAPYIQLSVANNGDPITEGFTIEDYISRGRYAATTGRSGLGGYHVHQIAKGHKGFLCLDSNKMWNMIVEVLLPIESTEYNDIPAYDNECI
mgnify:FL=1